MLFALSGTITYFKTPSDVAEKHLAPGQRFRLGDRVRVRLVRADLESNRIDFVLAEDDKASRGRGGAGKGPSRTAGRAVAARPSVEPVRLAPPPVKPVAKAKPASAAKKGKPAKASAKPAVKKTQAAKKSP